MLVGATALVVGDVALVRTAALAAAIECNPTVGLKAFEKERMLIFRPIPLLGPRQGLARRAIKPSGRHDPWNFETVEMFTVCLEQTCR